MPEETEPTFVYLIHADVTDGSGETRSDNTQISVGYTTLAATMHAEAWQTTAKPVELRLAPDRSQAFRNRPEAH